MTAFEPEIEWSENEQRNDQHDPEVVGVTGQRVRAVDTRTVHRSVHVDLASTTGERREHHGVEVSAAARVEELEDAVDRVDGDAGAEPAEGAPEVVLTAPRDPH